MNLGMRSRLAAALICLLGLTLPASRTHALQFDQITISPTEVIVGGRGPIVKGDTDRLQQALAAVPQSKRLLGLALDSPGGNVVEGEQLAKLIRARGLPVVIPSNSKCISACFLLLAASTRRLAASDALVGVHSASEAGEETDTSLAVTTLMARVAAEMGIPPAIIGKMVSTKAASVEWLTHADLLSMDVTIFDNDAPSATRQAGVSAGVQIIPAPTQAAPQPPHRRRRLSGRRSASHPRSSRRSRRPSQPASRPAATIAAPGTLGSPGCRGRIAMGQYLPSANLGWRETLRALARRGSRVATSRQAARQRASGWPPSRSGCAAILITPRDGTAPASPLPLP